jgi:hypothetical protein
MDSTTTLMGVQVGDLLGEDSDGEVGADTARHAFYSSDAFAAAFSPVSAGPPVAALDPAAHQGSGGARAGSLSLSVPTSGGSGGARARSLSLSVTTSTPQKMPSSVLSPMKRVCALEMPPPQLKKILSEERGSLRGLASIVRVLKSTLISDFLRYMY